MAVIQNRTVKAKVHNFTDKPKPWERNIFYGHKVAMELGRLTTIASLTIKHYKRPIFNNHGLTSCSLLSCRREMIIGSNRAVHTQYLTKNMQYISNDEIKLIVDPVTMKLNKELEKPLCVMMNFMMESPKTVLKYADLYLTHDFDVIAVSCELWQFFWPVRGSQMVASRLLNFLTVNNCGCSHPVVVHGLSIGAYVWAELLVHTTRDKERYQPVLDRIAAQVWDSPTDIHEIPEGVSEVVFPRNKFLQHICRAYVKAHMKLFHNIATKHYLKATEVYHETPCRAPGLFLVSKTDLIGTEKRSRRAASMWEKSGIKCNFKCWDRSPHVQHYQHHREEYRTTLISHLNECGVLLRKI